MLVKTQAIILLEAGVASPYCLNVISQYSLYSVGTVIYAVLYMYSQTPHICMYIYMCVLMCTCTYVGVR